MLRKNKSIGLDLGIKDLCITSDGKKYKNPKIIKDMRKNYQNCKGSLHIKKGKQKLLQTEKENSIMPREDNEYQKRLSA